MVSYIGIYFWLFIVILFNSNITPQKRDPTLSTTLDSVIVKATRLAVPVNNSVFTVDIIDSLKLSSNINILSLKEALSSAPSVITNNRFNLSQGDRITIRGIGARAQFGIRGIKILLDGIPLTFADGQSQLNNLNISTLRRIEIIRGANSTLYGNASGGVIYAESDIGNTNRFYLKPELALGSFGLNKYSLGISSKFLSGGIGLNAFLTKSNGYRDHSNAMFGGFNLLSENNPTSKLKLNTVINYYNAPFLLNPSSLNKEDAINNPTKSRKFVVNQGAGKKVQQFQAGINLKYKLSTNSEITSAIFGIGRSLFNSIPNRIIELDRLAGGARLEYITFKKLQDINVRFIAGLDYEFQNDKRVEFVNLGLGENSELNSNEIFDNLLYGDKIQDQDESVKSIGLFSQIDLEPTKQFNFVIGIRYDNFAFIVDGNLFSDGVNNLDKILMDNFSPMIGASYLYLNDNTVYTNFATAFQTPTTTELSNNPNGTGGLNQNLKPEILQNFEIGTRGNFKKHGIKYNIAFFYINISDMLIPYQNQNEVTYYRNAGKAINKGFELMINWNAFTKFDFVLSYSFMNFRYTNFLIKEYNGNNIIDVQLSGNYIPGIPKNNLSFTTSYLTPVGIITKLNIIWSDKYFANYYNGPKAGINDNINNYINEEYLVINLSLLYSVNINTSKFLLKLGIENLFDTRYNDSIVPNAFRNNFFEPASGRAWYFITSLTL